MKTRAILTALICIALQSLYSQKNVKSFLVVSYNVEKYGKKLPAATCGGPEYYGGPSDHLPIYVKFTW